MGKTVSQFASGLRFLVLLIHMAKAGGHRYNDC